MKTNKMIFPKPPEISDFPPDRIYVYTISKYLHRSISYLMPSKRMKRQIISDFLYNHDTDNFLVKFRVTTPQNTFPNPTWPGTKDTYTLIVQGYFVDLEAK
jgi:hypothetical protein